MRKGQLLLIMFTVMVFSVSSFVAFTSHNQTINLLSISNKTTVWRVVRLETGYHKFVQALHLYALNEVDLETLMVRFEVLWSRTDVLLVGNESKDLRQQPQLLQTVVDLKSQLVELEARLEKLQPVNNAQYQSIVTAFEPFYQQIRDAVVDNFRRSNAQYDDVQSENIQIEIVLYLTGFIFSGLILLGLFWHERWSNHKLALYDALTQLPNRVNFYQQLAKSESLAKKHQSNFAVLLIDLDGFKAINDNFGHDIGDKVLITVAQRLEHLLGESDTVARLGGDEFVIIKNNLKNKAQAKWLAHQVVKELGSKFDLVGDNYAVSASVGISLYPRDTVNCELLQVNADMAMYQVKKEHGGGFLFYEQAMFNSIERRKQLAKDLLIAIENNQLKLVYQPMICFDSGKILCVEALLRWSHNQFGNIAPPEVIDIACAYGLGTKVDLWVLQQACRQNMLWQQAGLGKIQTSVNISPAMYRYGDLQQAVVDVLKETGLSPQQLVIEVTETTTMNDIESSPDMLFALAALGVDLALDDFGTGFSSLSHLKNLPLNKLKIDRSFVCDIDQDHNALRFIRTIVQLGKNLNMTVVAEGIETQEQYQLLAAEGCEQAQGFYLAKPQPASTINDLLVQQKAGVSLVSNI